MFHLFYRKKQFQIRIQRPRKHKEKVVLATRTAWSHTAISRRLFGGVPLAYNE